MFILKRAPIQLLKSVLSAVGTQHAADLIKAKQVDKGEFSPIAGIGQDWFLANDERYQFGKNGKVYRHALIDARKSASLAGDDVVFIEAGKLLDAIDGNETRSGAKSLPMKMVAWSTLEHKGLTENDDYFLLSGIASTPNPDRSSDIVEPLGAAYKLPLPFLWQHDSGQPIGEVYEAAPTKKGIPVKLRIPKFSEPGAVKDRLDEAVQSIKLGLVKGLSIGFSPVEYSFMEDGGVHFLEWQWLELSAVTIPANADATIKSVRDADEKQIEKRTMVKIHKRSSPTVASEPVDENPMTTVHRANVNRVNAKLFKN